MSQRVQNTQAYSDRWQRGRNSRAYWDRWHGSSSDRWPFEQNRGPKSPFERGNEKRETRA